ncbi:MAG: DUF2461 domain-containing protein [Clostridiales bacterium]|jgi:uncharacterized protein (DUF2461 family)|nr:DUF2461 domain-containing protein [Clostridiales bacterium]
MKTQNTVFCGFPRGVKEFMENLPFCNTFEAKDENITDYKRLISEPLGKLYETLLPAINEISPNLDTKRARCVSSPYNDRRFSPKAPLREYVYIRFRLRGREENSPGLYFDMGAEYYSYGIWIFKRTTPGLQALKESMLSKQREYSEALNLAISAGLSIGGEKYKKDRFPHMPDTPLKDILNRKAFYIGFEAPVGENIYTPKFADEISRALASLSKLVNLLDKETFD